MSGEEESSDEYDSEEDSEEEDSEDEEPEGMAYEKPTVSSIRLAANNSEDKRQRQDEAEMERSLDFGRKMTGAADNVRRLLTHRFGCCTRGWRTALDKRQAHRVGRAAFFAALRELGFQGDAKAAWCELTGASLRDLSLSKPSYRQVTLADVDPEGAKLLSDFFQCYTEKWGRELPTLLQGSESLRVRESEFLSRTEMMVEDEDDKPAAEKLDLKAVFKNLNSNNSITEGDVAWLMDYCTRSKQSTTDEPSAEPVISELAEQSREGRAKAARARTLQAFRSQLQHRFGSIIAGWRKVLDPAGKGELGKAAFYMACKRMAFQGEMADVWDALVFDRGLSELRFPREEDNDEEALLEDDYCVCIGDLEPAIPQCLSIFQKQCVARYGNMVKAFEEMEADKKPLVTREEFFPFCEEIGFAHNKRLLWEFLDERGVGAIVLNGLDEKAAGKTFAEEDIRIATKMLGKRAKVTKERPTIQARAERQCKTSKKNAKEEKSALKELMGQLEGRFESPVRAWSSLLDRQNRGKVDPQEFLVSASVAGFRGSKSKLLKELELEKGMVKFQLLAPDALQECKDFKQKAVGKLGKIAKSYEAPGERKKVQGAELPLKDFEQICKKIGFDGDAQRVFKHLDVQGKGTLNTKVLKALDTAGKDDKVVSHLVKRHHEQKEKKRQEAGAGKAVPTVKELTSQQDSLLQAGRERRWEKTAPKAQREEFLRAVEHVYGSVARAWRQAFDPKNRGEVLDEDFLIGCHRVGIMDQASDEDRAKYLAVFQLFADEETGAVTLNSLDPRTTQGLYEFRCRLAMRFGSVKQAFVEVDPQASGSMSTEQFRHICHESRITNNIRRLLEYLDPQDQGTIPLSLIDGKAAKQAKILCEDIMDAQDMKREIDERMGRSHMKSAAGPIGVPVGVQALKEKRETEAGEKLANELRRRLVSRHGTLVRAWHTSLKPAEKPKKEPDEKDAVFDFKAFEGLFQGLGMEGSAKSAWRAIVGKRKAMTLELLDPGSCRELGELRSRLLERFGSLERCFDELDGEQNSFEVDAQGFRRLCQDCQFRGNERRLFLSLDVENNDHVSFAAIDSQAVEAVKEKRAKEEAILERERERKAKLLEEAEETEPQSTSSASRSKVLPPTETTGEELPPALRSFRDLLQRRFGGSFLRAWQALDVFGRNALNKQEFARGVQATGYAGNVPALWAALGGKDGGYVSVRDLAPEVMEVLASFRYHCLERFRKTELQEVFVDEDGTSKRFSREDFETFCRKVRLERASWRPLFEQLDARNIGAVTWDDLRFLEENWRWDVEDPFDPKPIRKSGNPAPLRLQDSLSGASASPSRSASRVSGAGPLCTSMKPRRVTGLRKYNSLPAIVVPPLRDNWNDRHHVLDTLGNKDMQLVHMVTCVQTKARDRIRRKVAKKMEEVPTGQWLQQNVFVDDEEDDF